MSSKPADAADSRKDRDKEPEPPDEHISMAFAHRKTLPKAFDLSETGEPGTGVTAQEMKFVRRVTELLPILSQAQVEALRERIASGYYANPEVTRIIARRLAEIFGTD
jgi:hypothetical protein